MGARAPVTQGRVAQPKMYDISAYDDIWSLAAKEEIYGAWDPDREERSTPNRDDRACGRA